MIKESEFINFFRAIAAFWVLAAHCMIWGGWYGIPLPSAKIAVDLFMMISGYLMASNAFTRNSFEPLSTRRNWLRFWFRRFFRLAPAYYLSLALAILMSSYFLDGYQELQKMNPDRWPIGGTYDPSKIDYTIENILLHLSFLFGLHPSYSFSTFLPDWSLSLEMQFYFVFPIVLFVMNKFGFIKIGLSISIFTMVVAFCISKILNIHFNEPSFLFLKLQYFIAGILVFRVLGVHSSIRSRFALAACAIFIVSLDYRYGTQLFVIPLLLLSMLFFGWLEATNRMPLWMRSIISCRLTRFASNTSYGVYLFHGFFISASGLIISSNVELLELPSHYRVIIMFLFVSICAYLTAYVIYRLIELPGISFGKQVIQRILPLNNAVDSEAVSV